jgi:hypothetical protein
VSEECPPVSAHGVGRCSLVAWQLRGVRFGTLEYVLRLESHKGNATRLRLARLASAYTLTVTAGLVVSLLVKSTADGDPKQVRCCERPGGPGASGPGGV